MPVPTGSLLVNHRGQVDFLNPKAVVLIVRQTVDGYVGGNSNQEPERKAVPHTCSGVCANEYTCDCVTACCTGRAHDTLAHMCIYCWIFSSQSCMYCFPGPFLGVHFPKCQVSISPSHLPNWISCGQGPLNKCTFHLDLLEENKRCFPFWEGIILMHANMQRQNPCKLSG